LETQKRQQQSGHRTKTALSIDGNKHAVSMLQAASKITARKLKLKYEKQEIEA
jgi:hypothetical protein